AASASSLPAGSISVAWWTPASASITVRPRRSSPRSTTPIRRVDGQGASESTPACAASICQVARSPGDRGPDGAMVWSSEQRYGRQQGWGQPLSQSEPARNAGWRITRVAETRDASERDTCIGRGSDAAQSGKDL